MTDCKYYDDCPVCGKKKLRWINRPQGVCAGATTVYKRQYCCAECDAKGDDILFTIAREFQRDNDGNPFLNGVKKDKINYYLIEETLWSDGDAMNGLYLFATKFDCIEDAKQLWRNNNNYHNADEKETCNGNLLTINKITRISTSEYKILRNFIGIT